jgi:GntR family transcriptional regulator, transcriptional repressor for pyruvate dehydrogenase complex
MCAAMRRPQRLSLTQQCAESMKQHIAGNTLKSGDRLPTEQEWVEMLGVSRLVIREALQMLAGIGLIDIQQGRGTFVRDTAQISVFDQLTFGLDLQQMSYVDVLEARAMLDLAVLELCMIRADQRALDDLERLLLQMDEAGKAGEPVHMLHRQFHHRMLRAGGNPLIERIGIMLMDTFWRMGDSIPELVFLSNEPVGDHQQQIDSHRMLIEAIRSRNIAQSRQLIAKHLPFQSGVSYVFPIVTDDVPKSDEL